MEGTQARTAWSVLEYAVLGFGRAFDRLDDLEETQVFERDVGAARARSSAAKRCCRACGGTTTTAERGR